MKGIKIQFNHGAHENTGGEQKENLGTAQRAGEVPQGAPPTGEATAEQIEAWKKLHKDGIYVMKVDGRFIYFKNPSRFDLNCAYAKMSNAATYDMYEELANITCIGGDKTLLADDQYFIGIANRMKGKLDGKVAELVNL
jgi:hypothetical protein